MLNQCGRMKVEELKMSCLEKFRQRIVELQAEAEELETLRDEGKTASKFLEYMIRSDVRCND